MRTVYLVVAAVLMTACSHTSALNKGQMKDKWTQVSDEDYLRTRGVGVAPDSARGRTKRRALARSAALVAARYEMLSVLKGVTVTGGLSVEDLITKNSNIKEVADKLIEGAEEKVTEWTEDDGCVVVLELKRSKVREILLREESRRTTPLPEEVRRFWASAEARDYNERVAAVYSAGKEDEARRAAALGILFPGLGQVAAAKHVRNPTEARALRTRGWATMALGLGWGAGAYVSLSSPSRKTRDAATGREKQDDSGKALGYGALGLAALTQYWGARDAYGTLAQDRLSLTVEPSRDGAQVVLARRF